jgi:hypothetical protein
MTDPGLIYFYILIIIFLGGALFIGIATTGANP